MRWHCMPNHNATSRPPAALPTPQVEWLHRLPTTHLVAFYLKYLCDAFQ